MQIIRDIKLDDIRYIWKADRYNLLTLGLLVCKRIIVTERLPPVSYF
jgi:hypothetical protein